MELVNQKWIEMPPDIVTGHHQLQQMLEEGNWEALDHGYKCLILMAYSYGKSSQLVWDMCQCINNLDVSYSKAREILKPIITQEEEATLADQVVDYLAQYKVIEITATLSVFTNMVQNDGFSVQEALAILRVDDKQCKFYKRLLDMSEDERSALIDAYAQEVTANYFS